MIAVLGHDYEEYTIAVIAERWEAFALERWNDLAGHCCCLDVIAEEISWHSDYDKCAEDAVREMGWPRDDRPVGEHGDWWHEDNLDEMGFIEGRDYDVHREELDTFVHVTVVLTMAGKRRALEWAKELIEAECAESGNPVPWESTP